MSLYLACYTFLALEPCECQRPGYVNGHSARQRPPAKNFDEAPRPREQNSARRSSVLAS
ncbi:hypothetical protein SUS17_2475 [Sphingomonas sp. S17]|nr:hypothetical protein SUS17_2475 [Sphingomonas sp. S17]